MQAKGCLSAIVIALAAFAGGMLGGVAVEVGWSVDQAPSGGRVIAIFDESVQELPWSGDVDQLASGMKPLYRGVAITGGAILGTLSGLSTLR